MALLNTVIWGPAWLPWAVRLDPLAGFFLLIVGILTLAVSSYAPGYVREFEHDPYSLAVLGLFSGLFVSGMMLVLLANNVFVFVVAWELMSLASYFLVGYQYRHAAHRRAAFLYIR
ncbi:MAG: hypothetical protein SVR94_15350 [Pseudomonadota bacterium]|nr:hypothetical protein [Pseudomonadota bacterium]